VTDCRRVLAVRKRWDDQIHGGGQACCSCWATPRSSATERTPPPSGVPPCSVRARRAHCPATAATGLLVRCRYRVAPFRSRCCRPRRMAALAVRFSRYSGSLLCARSRAISRSQTRHQWKRLGAQPGLCGGIGRNCSSRLVSPQVRALLLRVRRSGGRVERGERGLNRCEEPHCVPIRSFVRCVP
jgi:hypothetical protein